MAEDEGNISDFVSRGLKGFDYDVTTVDNGTEAWRLLSEGHRYDLVLLDIRMPGMTGIEVCRRIREAFGYQLPVLLLTALDTTEDVVNGLQSGADDYLAKPFKFVELLARIQALLRRAESNADRSCMVCGACLRTPRNWSCASCLCRRMRLSICQKRLIRLLARAWKE